MAVLTVTLFGYGAIARDGVPVRVHSARTLALLAFLAAESDRPHPRARLAALLWSEAPEPAARQSLRQALYSLRRVGVGIQAGPDPALVRLAPHPDLRIDVLRFLACVKRSDPESWSEAAVLHRAPLLDGQVLPGCNEYEGWLAGAREHLRSLASQNRSRLVVACLARGDDGQALHHAEALRTLDPMNELASRGMMKLFAARSEPHRVEAEWERLSATLQRELGAAPSALTRETYLGLGGQIGGHGPERRGARRAAPDASAVVRAAQAAERVYAFGHALDLYERALRILRSLQPPPHARICELLIAKESVLDRLGRRAEQWATLDEAVALARTLADPPRLAVALLRRAGAGAYLGPDEGEAGLAAAGQALALQREARDRPGEAEALRELGFLHWRLGQPGAALELSRQALALHRSLGDVAGEATALHNLAEIHRGLGSTVQALELYRDALRLHWAVRNPAGEILTRFGMAGALLHVGQPGEATHEYQAALEMSERHGEHTMHARVLQALATLAHSQGGLDDALRYMRRAVAIDRSINYAHALGHDLVALSVIHQQRNERTEARAALQEALVWFEYTDDLRDAASVRRRLDDLEAGHAPEPASPGWVMSHLPLPEGKVYCAFESPLAQPRR